MAAWVLSGRGTLGHFGLDDGGEQVLGLVQLVSQGHVGLDGDQGQVCRLGWLGQGACKSGVSSG